MKTNSIFYSVWLLSIVTTGIFVEANADTVTAWCDVYPRGEDHTSVSIPCEFSQRQGFVTIDRSDGVYHDLRPTGEERVFNFDQGNVTTPGDGALGWRRQEGDWHINIDDNEFYTVVEAAVYGG